MKPLVVINVVGLTPSLLGKHTPCLNSLVDKGFMAQLEGVFPALTCTAQATMLTGSLPNVHGIVANGWYFRDLSEVFFWRQANQLVGGEKVWDAARNMSPAFTCAQHFWWYNMYADVEWSVTPRPIYPADGRKIPALYSSPASLHHELEAKLGQFPFFDFWGPKAGLPSSRWIADSALELFQQHRPQLSLVYLPHLDYNMQRLGPDDPRISEDIAQIDQVVGRLIDGVIDQDADVMIVSEYGIEQVTGAVPINQVLRQQGLLAVRETLGWELLDCGASIAFAVADHQVAHIYVNDQTKIGRVKKLLESTAGIERVLGAEDKVAWGVDHARSGELIAIAEAGCWFNYYYWLDDNRAPDFARTVDIHRKPGYDPVELFVDPDLPAPKLKIALRLLQKKLGMRMLMDVIPLKPELVKGSHGRAASNVEQGPLLISNRKEFAIERLHMTDVKALILKHWI